MLQILGSALLMVGILVVLTRATPGSARALAAFAAAAFAIMLLRAPTSAVPLFAAERQARSELAGFVEERIGGLDDIRANGGGAHVMRALGRAQRRPRPPRGVAGRSAVAAIYIVLIANGLFIAGFGMALGLGVWLFQHGQATHRRGLPVRPVHRDDARAAGD